MLTLTDDELQREPSKLLDDAHRGQVTVVSNQGQALLMTVPLNHGAPAPGALLDLAATLYASQQISLRRAAEIDGLGSADMMDEPYSQVWSRVTQ